MSTDDRFQTFTRIT